MHIPDGYLSPSTCATLYVGAAAGWYSALRRLKRVLFTRVVPLISVFAGAILALSIAIAIQALFFGDGGISTLGANCFNMAIAGSLVAYASYRMVAAGSAITSKRRVVAAAVAGYLAVNASALLAATEFGIQPVLFHDAGGTPLYAPYPLSIAIPAMMIGHLTFAGLAEAVISAGLVAYLQAADPGLLRGTSGLAFESAPADLRPETRSLQPLWLATAVLMLLTPLGILAAGTAWGEWSPSELAHAASPSVVSSAPTPTAPAGLQRLSNLWTAPFPAYAPTFVRSRGFGYLLSAMFGVGLVLAFSLFVRRLLDRNRRKGYAS